MNDRDTKEAERIVGTTFKDKGWTNDKLADNFATALRAARREGWEQGRDSAAEKVNEYADFQLSEMKYQEQARQVETASSRATRNVAAVEIEAAIRSLTYEEQK